MRVEAGRHEQQLRPMGFERGQPVLADGRPKLIAAAAGGERDVDHVRTELFHARIRIQRMLERRDHQHARIVGEDLLGAVAVVDVEVDHRHALEGVRGERVRHADGDVVEETEPHRAIALGMVSGRPHSAERRRALSPHDQVGREHDGSRRMQRSRQRFRAHRRVGIDVVQPRGRAFLFDRREVPLSMDPRKLLMRRRRGVVVLKVGIEPRADEAVADGQQPVGAFGVIRSHVVQQGRRVADERSRHGACFELKASRRDQRHGLGKNSAEGPPNGV